MQHTRQIKRVPLLPQTFTFPQQRCNSFQLQPKATKMALATKSAFGLKAATSRRAVVVKAQSQTQYADELVQTAVSPLTPCNRPH